MTAVFGNGEPCGRRSRRFIFGTVLVAAVTVSACASISLASAARASSSAPPNLIGAYSVHAVCTSCGGSTYDWTFQITTEDSSAGSFSGMGTYSDGTTTASLAGTISGNSI